jgi:ectoine hydroxylase-related dioxygenase (phytanoyl-CoA dioxygenase family)
MLGFIVMIDAFTTENGATRFWPGSHRLNLDDASEPPPESEIVAAEGPPGAVVVYNGSVRHGHGANRTNRARRSIQGAYIRRDAVGFGLPARMRSTTLERLGPLAKYLIDL